MSYVGELCFSKSMCVALSAMATLSLCSQASASFDNETYQLRVVSRTPVETPKIKFQSKIDTPPNGTSDTKLITLTHQPARIAGADPNELGYLAEAFGLTFRESNSKSVEDAIQHELFLYMSDNSDEENFNPIREEEKVNLSQYDCFSTEIISTYREVDIEIALSKKTPPIPFITEGDYKEIARLNVYVKENVQNSIHHYANLECSRLSKLKSLKKKFDINGNPEWDDWRYNDDVLFHYPKLWRGRMEYVQCFEFLPYEVEQQFKRSASSFSGTYTVNEDWTRLRSKKNTDADKLRILRIGERVRVLSAEDGEIFRGSSRWFVVSHDGALGYIHSALLTKES